VRVTVGDIEDNQPDGIRPDIDDREGFEIIRELRRNASVSIGCWRPGANAPAGLFLSGGLLASFFKRAAAS
jgi:hypothetical protein